LRTSGASGTGYTLSTLRTSWTRWTNKRITDVIGIQPQNVSEWRLFIVNENGLWSSAASGTSSTGNALCPLWAG